MELGFVIFVQKMGLLIKRLFFLKENMMYYYYYYKNKIYNYYTLELIAFQFFLLYIKKYIKKS
jgi:hypothetical protein